MFIGVRQPPELKGLRLMEEAVANDRPDNRLPDITSDVISVQLCLLHGTRPAIYENVRRIRSWGRLVPPSTTL